jgi:hypothetical protein
MNESFKTITKKSGLALIAAFAAFGGASPALAQSYSFPTYAYLRSATGPAPARKVGLYNAIAPANTPWAADANAWGSSAARGISR